MQQLTLIKFIRLHSSKVIYTYICTSSGKLLELFMNSYIYCIKNDCILGATIKMLIKINSDLLRLKVNVSKRHLIKYGVLCVDKSSFNDDRFNL